MNSEIKIYTDISSLTESQIKNLNPLLAFHWKDLDLKAMLEGAKNHASLLTLTRDPGEAEWFVLPMLWSYYLWNRKSNMHQALALSVLASHYKKRLVVWHSGDLVPIMPFDGAQVFLPGMLRSKAEANQIACPAFIDDPQPIWGNSRTLIREKQDKPKVGFCGYGSIDPLKFAWSILAGLKLNIASSLKKYDFNQVPIVPATSLRARALRNLESHPDIETCFLIRDKHTTAKRSKIVSNGASATEVFYSNIYETDYTLCLRGFGNWSYRFYETLACGRIPIFVDTDCVLPLSSKIDWRRFCVWIDSSERHRIGEKVFDFHSALSPTDFVELQKACRRLWREHFSLEGCMRNISAYLQPDAKTGERNGSQEPVSMI